MKHSETICSAIDYILTHINEPIHVEEIAAHCNFSKYHFSRLFKAETGESVYAFIKRVRIEQSAFHLKTDIDKTITDIGIKYGYSSSNYSSAFKQQFEMSPVKFRSSILQRSLENPIFKNRTDRLESLDQCKSKITIEVLPDYHVIYERHKGSYRNLSEHWGEFQDRYKEYRTEETLLLECTYNDPNITDSDGCLYDLYMTVPEGVPLENTRTLKGGKFAVYHFCDNVDQIYRAYQSIFTTWLPQSGYLFDDRHGFDIYRKIDCATMRMEIDFCIPLQ